jgi:hypothetical protein
MSAMNYPAVDALIDTMNRQRSVDQFQTRFNVPFQSQMNLAGIPMAGARFPHAEQTLDAAIQSMYLPSAIHGNQRLTGLGIPPLSMGTIGGQRFGLGVSSCTPGLTCAPGCSPLEWTPRNVPYSTFGWNQNMINPSFGTFGSTQRDIFGKQPAFHQGFFSGSTDYPLKSATGEWIYQQPTAQSEKVLHGLLLDRLEGLRASNFVEDALNLLKGQRSTDQVWKLLASGVNVDPSIVAQAIKVDRTVDFKVAELVQNTCDYRRRNSEAVHLSEHLMSGKVYDGPIYNSVKEQAKMAAMNTLKNQLIDLYALYGRV